MQTFDFVLVCVHVANRLGEITVATTLVPPPLPQTNPGVSTDYSSSGYNNMLLLFSFAVY